VKRAIQTFRSGADPDLKRGELLMRNSYVERAKKVIPDAQILSVVAARRARQLAQGARPMIKCDSENHIDVALLEIAEGLLTYEFGSKDEAVASELSNAEAILGKVEE
jgi:DNA-directed RNA polymerase omega subunit